MDIEGIPPPPPEEFEGSFHDVPLPPVDPVSWNQGPSGQQPYGSSYNSNGSYNYGDSGAAWQRAVDALNQSVPVKTLAYGSYPASYPPPMPPPGWQPSSYAYPTNYPNSYQQQSHNTQPMNVNHPYGQGYHNPPAQYGQAATQQPQYQRHAQPHQPSYGAPRAPAPQNPYRSRPPRPSVSRYTYHPYPTPATSTVQQKLDTRMMPPTAASAVSSSFYSGYATAPSTSTGSGVSDHSIDMDIDEVTTTTPTLSSLPQKQAPGAGGIRFQLSKKFFSETKISNPLLQKRVAPPNQFSSSSTSSSHLPTNTPTTTQQNSTTGPPSSSFTASPSKSLNVSSGEWPVSLQNYFAKAIALTPPEKVNHVMSTITQMVTNAYKTNTLHICKWEKAPMPYADEASNALFGLSPKRENSPPDVKFRGSTGRGRGARSSSRRGRVGGRRSNSDQSDDDDRSSQVSSSSRARNGNVKSSSPRNAGFSGEDYLSLRKSSSSAKKGKKGAQSGPRGKLLGFGAEAHMTEEDRARIRKRQERFGDVSNTSSDSLTASASAAIKSSGKLRKNKSSVSAAANPFKIHAGPVRGKSGQRAVVGTCQTVEKEYFRLTEEAEPSVIRPLAILEQALDLVREKWKKEHNYRYAESQLKSMRQDLRVQHIFSSFTVKVYEMHSRIALEVGDQAEFTQCLSQLEWLYDTLSAVHRGALKTGKVSCLNGDVVKGCENRREFLSYRILYVMRQNRTTDMTRVRSQLSDEDKKDTCIAFAFSVLSAYFAGDYQQFFSLYKNAPMMAGYVMDVSIPLFRQKMLIKICTAYRPNLPVMALKEILCFNNEPELREFLKAYRLTYTWLNGSEEIDCKASLAVVKAGPEILQPGEAQAQPLLPPPPRSPIKSVTTTPLRTASKTRRKIAVATA